MRVLTLVVISLVISFAAHAGPQADSDAAAALLKELPRQSILRAARDTVVGSEFPAPVIDAAQREALAEEQIAKAKEIIPKLRKLITPGRSVFDFPGLIARGEVTWSGSSYQLYLGVYLRVNPGSGPYDFRITFDAKGKILSIDDVLWKS